jgi:hypothetical protein
MGIMFTGVAVLGILAGSLASLFGVTEPPVADQPATGEEQEADELRAELLALQEDMRAADARLAALLARERASPAAGD